LHSIRWASGARPSTGGIVDDARDLMALRLLILPHLPLLVALGVGVGVRRGARTLGWIAGITAAAALLLTCSLAPPIVGGEVVTVSIPWAPAAGLSLSFFADGLSLLFCLLITGIGLLIVVYARAYLSEAEPLPRFYASLLLFMAAMLGVVTAGNLLLLVIFWELTSLASFLLIGFRDQEAAARSGAYQSLIVTGLGGLSLLAGVLVLGQAAGTYELQEMLANAETLRNLPAAPIALVLMLFGAFTKSAQVPFHFWLPSAMAAPTPVSAYLHSATMVKAGLFLVARLSPIFAPTDLWFYSITGVGTLTMLAGGWGALRQTDLKALLAYSTISQLGLIMLLYGCNTELASLAATFHILNHATFKAPLFMAAGIVDHEAGSRDLRHLGGLAGLMPRTALFVAVAAAAMAGVAPLNGFLSKELLYEATLDLGDRGAWGTLVPLLALAGSMLTVAYSLRLVIGAFFGARGDFPHPPHEAPPLLRLPGEVLALLCVTIGLVPNVLAAPLVDAATAAVVAGPVHAHFALWHGWTPALGMSLVALPGGIAYYVARRSTARQPLPPRLGRTASEIYDLAVAGLLDGARQLTDAIQRGSLRFYVRVVVGLTLALTVAGGLGALPAPVLAPATAPLTGAWTVAGVTIVAAYAVAALNRHRLPSVIALAVVGLLVAVYFVWLSAPDLVLTQLLVEAVTTILIVLVLYFLPKETPGREPRRRVVTDAALSLAVGIGVTAVVYAVLRRPFASISSYHLAKSLAEAGGRNVVNVILVDFRGYDTLGEITVLAIAAIGVRALIQAGRRAA
jgi:multicomponent K+:H+ antiporter subunit A